MTTPKVQYTYANGSGNQIRPTQMTYPDGRELNLDYGLAGSQGDLLSRVAAQVDDDGTTHLADSSYLGVGTPVITDYTQPDVRYTLVGTAGGNDPDTGDIYRGLDRFGRVKDAYWRDYGANADAARIQYGYDRASNRTYRADPVAVANSAQYEELYAYDGLQRLANMQRGTLNGSKTGLTAQSFDQCWTLDPTGNWKGFRQDDTGDGVWDLIQARTANPVNEITNISNSVGSAWANPAYNAAGNMTTIPKPADPTQSFAATYDAWNRLVKLSDGANTVAEYEYDARNFRTVQKSYAGGVLDETRHIYYTPGWQAIEERLGTSPDSADPDRQFVWGLRYIDDLILRDRDTNGDGTLDERLYALQDGNWNVIALTDTAGDVQERYAYQAYGTPKFLTEGFGNRATSSYEWETLFAGYRYDYTTGQFPIRLRILNPVIGTWSQRDPFIYYNSHNLLDYALSSPLLFVDPSGAMAQAGAAAGCFGGGPIAWAACAGVIVVAAVVAVDTGVRYVLPNKRVQRSLPAGTGQDEKKVSECCENDKVCLEALSDLFEQIASIPGWATGRRGEGDKCMIWCAEFLKKYFPDRAAQDESVSLANGQIVIEPKEAAAKDSWQVGSRRWYGLPNGYFTDHCYFKVTIKQCTAYFDVGENTNLGSFGGDDNWFFPEDPGFNETMDLDTEKVFF